MKSLYKDFKKAIKRLEEVLSLKKNEVIRDSAIMRFQLCFDLAWKAIKLYAKDQGVECFSPKGCFKTAFQLGLIDYDENWLKMVDDRNLITHLYEEKVADKIYEKLKDYLSLFRNLETKLTSE